MVQDAMSGMNDGDFREYIPSAGRWLSPDPGDLAAVSLANPQSLNRYTYVGSNPTNLVDPWGLGPCDNNPDLPACNHEPHLNDAAGTAAACMEAGLLPNCAGPWGSGELGAAEAAYF
jgi:RHS repeat-associated protein